MSNSFAAMWDAVFEIGRNPGTGGYNRFVWNDADQTMREWFAGEAASRGFDLHVDRNGNQWAWWGDPTAGDALVLGSHLDSVPEGGAYDGPLGVLSSYAALDSLRTQGFRQGRPIAVVNFVDEEGARFGIACAGSRLLTGGLDPERARALRGRDGHTMAEVLRQAGREPGELGRDDDLLTRIGCFVELHVEQGRDLVDRGQAVGLGSGIWPHGRFRFDFTGEANHAGTTRMEDRRDPMLTYAMTALAANKQARLAAATGEVRATFGRVEVEPGGTNAVPSRVRAWMDARAAEESTLRGLVETVTRLATERAGRDDTSVTVVPESESPPVRFDRALASRLAARLGGVPIIPTAAGHDAGVLSAAGIPTAMLFVRNPTGVSHSPEEFAERDDCLAGVEALAACVEELAGGAR